MSFTIHRDPKPGLLHLVGDFTYGARPAFQEATQVDVGAAEPAEIHLDFAGVQYLGSSALGMLLQLRDQCEARGKKVILINLFTHAASLFRSAGFSKLFQILTTGLA